MSQAALSPRTPHGRNCSASFGPAHSLKLESVHIAEMRQGCSFLPLRSWMGPLYSSLLGALHFPGFEIVAALGHQKKKPWKRLRNYKPMEDLASSKRLQKP